MTAELSQRQTLTAPAEAEGGRLDKWLSEAASDLSRSRARALIEEGALEVNGRVETDPRAKVKAGADYVITLPEPDVGPAEPENIPLEILFEDEHLVIVNKPSGMVVHPAPGQPRGTLVNALLYHCGASLTGIGGIARPGIVHRLDKDTSGVMVCAKTDVTHTALTELFQAHDIERAYLALTRGCPRPYTARIETRIARSPNDRKKMAVVRERRFKHDPYADDPDRQGDPSDPHGKIAITNYRVLATYGRTEDQAGAPAAAKVECRLETGRTHQIRVHMSHIGAPVLGDPVYSRHKGIKAAGKGPSVERALAAAHDFPRQALHAFMLGFVHPVTGKALSFEATPPEDFLQLEAALAALP